MDFMDENELTLNQQLFNLQMVLEKELKSIDYKNNAIVAQNTVFSYFDHILDNKLVTIDDFGYGMQSFNTLLNS